MLFLGHGLVSVKQARNAGLMVHQRLRCPGVEDCRRPEENNLKDSYGRRPNIRKINFFMHFQTGHKHAASARRSHAPALGCPKPIRNQYKTDGNWQTYTREFLKYIQTQDASLRELVKIAQATPACLVCFEADFSTCHRTYVARAARQLGGPTVMHLTAKTALPDLGFQQAA